MSVKFVRFYAGQKGDDVKMRWITESEYDNEFFTVERSINMQDWEILKILPGSGGSPGAGEYVFTDLDPNNGKNFYRIKQTDFDGSFEYSHIEDVIVDFSLNDDIEELTVAPNPVLGPSTNFKISAKTTLKGASVKLIDITGKEIQVIVDINDTEITISPINKTPGLYFLIIQKGDQSIVEKIKFE